MGCTPAAYTTTNGDKIRVEYVGGNYALWINDQLMGVASDTTFTLQTGVGWGANDTTARFDSFSVTQG